MVRTHTDKRGFEFGTNEKVSLGIQLSISSEGISNKDVYSLLKAVSL